MGADDWRVEKGRMIAAIPGAIQHVSPLVYTVKSQSGPGDYRVTVTESGVECNCPDFTKRNLPCKHILSVTQFFIERQTVLPTGEIHSERVPVTYKQAWKAYNEAQMEEIHLFDILLRDLVADVPEPEYQTGRPSIPLSNQLFCAVQKVYSQMSCRRAWGLFANAVEHGQLPKAPYFGVSSEVLNREDVTAMLQDLITRSALPLAGLEEGFAPDSTGIQTSSFGAWREEKHGEKRERLWLKAHALAGVKTHIIVRAEVTDKDGADNTVFEPLLKQTAAAGVQLKAVYADKAYCARSNYILAKELSFDLYVPFKSNSTAKPKGAPLWRKAFHFFQMHREDFEAKYHARSDVESVFSALKRKFGETLKSKNYTSQVNEILAKILAYNITVLIHEIFEHGVVPDFFRVGEAARLSANSG